jgi:hypothetical protein
MQTARQKGKINVKEGYGIQYKQNGYLDESASIGGKGAKNIDSLQFSRWLS